jgi:hypothetical protein
MPTLPQSTRYANFDNTLVYFLPAVVGFPNAVTRAEITAGTDITGEIADIAGFTVSGGEIDTPDLKSEFTSKIPGRTSAEDSSLTFYASLDGADARALFPYKTVGYIAFLDGGDVPTKPMDVFPIRVKSVGKPRSVGEEAAKVVVGFSITREPAFDVAIPALGGT